MGRGKVEESLEGEGKGKKKRIKGRIEDTYEGEEKGEEEHKGKDTGDCKAKRGEREGRER